jgi:hypothetical protein
MKENRNLTVFWKQQEWSAIYNISCLHGKISLMK